MPVEITGEKLHVQTDAVLLGAKIATPVSELLHRDYGLTPDALTCPALFESARPFTCRGSFGKKQVELEVTLDAGHRQVASVKSGTLVKGHELEARAREAWTGSKVMVPVCLERSYLLDETQEVLCETTLDGTTVAFRKSAKGIDVRFVTEAH